MKIRPAISAILIISLFVWTASAVGNTENKIKNKNNIFENQDNVLVTTDNSNGYTLGDNVDNSFDNNLSDNNTIDNNLSDNNLSDNNLSDNNLSDNNLSDNNTIDNNLSDNNTIDNNLSDNNLSDNNLSDNNLSDNNLSDNNLSDNNTIDNTLSDNTLSDNNLSDNNINDVVGNIGASGISDLYSSTQAPLVTLISPEDCFVDTAGSLNFSFIADDALSAQYKDMNLSYEVDVDGQPVDGQGTGIMHPGEYVEISDNNLSEGYHSWSVSVTDDAGNNVTSDSRDFYVDTKGLKVSLVSPKSGYTTTNTPFKFRVSGGTGLPFNYTLLIDGEAVKSTCDGSDNNTLEVGEDFATDFSINAKVSDGEDKIWTVNVTDCAGNSYEPDPYHFSLDTTVPARVANLSATDSIGETKWSYTHDSPRLYVSWDANKEGDLASVTL